MNKKTKVYIHMLSRFEDGLNMCRYIKDAYSVKEDAVNVLSQDYEKLMRDFNAEGKFWDDILMWSASYGKTEILEWIVERELK